MDDFAIRTDDCTASMGDPLAFFITWPTYGTWLPGDSRGWVEFRNGWQLPKPALEIECKARMTEDACRLCDAERQIVEAQIVETSNHRGWILHIANCRSNHVHIVISAIKTKPKKIRADLKAWCTRRLKQSNPKRANWWADRGSIRWVWNEQSLARVIEYASDAQDCARIV